MSVENPEINPEHQLVSEETQKELLLLTNELTKHSTPSSMLPGIRMADYKKQSGDLFPLVHIMYNTNEKPEANSGQVKILMDQRITGGMKLTSQTVWKLDTNGQLEKHIDDQEIDLKGLMEAEARALIDLLKQIKEQQEK